MERSMLCSKFYVENGWRTFFRSNMARLFSGLKQKQCYWLLCYVHEAEILPHDTTKVLPKFFLIH